MVSSGSELDERFIGTTLDADVWIPYYLPQWSSRAESAAAYEVRDGELHLSIPVDHPRWCTDTYDGPLRVSCIQSGVYSGPVGSTIGQQPFKDGLEVREEQPTFWGYTPLYGQIEVRMRGAVTARSMFAFWMSGIEDQPERGGEICVAEIFGSGIHGSSAEIGMGVKRLRDPELRQEFSVMPMEMDVASFHTYGVDWRPGSIEFAVDGTTVRRLAQAPDYPLQLMIGVFDFPAASPAYEKGVPIPELVVSHVRGVPFSPSHR